MRYTYQLVIGDKTYGIEGEFASMAEFFQEIAPMQAMEIVSRGMTGVYLSHRNVGDNHFYALLRPDQQLEFHFGLLKKGNGKMFPGKKDKTTGKTQRGWTPVQYGLQGDDDSEIEPTTGYQQPATSDALPSEPKSEQEERLTVQIRELMDAAGIDNLGREKHKILNSLGLKVGLLLKDLSYHQKLDLYQVLFEEAKAMSGKRAAA